MDVVFGPDSNLYVPCFDVGVVIKINGQTGSVMGQTAGPPGKGLGSAVLGSDGNIYVTTLDLNDFTGEVYRYSMSTGTLTPHIPAGSGGLTSAGGIAVSTNGDLLVSDLLFDQNFIDIGSRILQYNGKTGEPVGTVISSGSDLNIPFFMTTVVSVELDIKPGDSTVAVIQPKSQGRTPVALLSTRAFDAPRLVNQATLRFGRTGYETSLMNCSTPARDVNGDALPDLLCYFDSQKTGFESNNTTAILTGKTITNVDVIAQAAIVVR